MLKVVIDGIYYKENGRFRHFNARLKKDCVYFYDYDKYVQFILDSMGYSDLQKLRLNIRNYYHKLIKFTMFRESDLNGGFFEGYKIHSDIIDVDVSDFALLIPDSKLRKKFFIYDEIRERYFYKSDFINYVNLNVV